MKGHTVGGRTRVGGACRHLAVRVIHQAFRDLSDSGGSASDRESARVFLSGSPMLYRWCDLAELEPTSMIVRAAPLVAQSAHGAANRPLRVNHPRR